jgi:phage shock protein PspC (stress-responsive transcriptional regulator)
MLGGVCGGLGEYINIDPNLIRFIFLILFFGGGLGFWLYVFLWIFIPEEGYEKEFQLTADQIGERVKNVGDDFIVSVTQPHPQAGLIVGSALIFLGAFLLLDNLNIPWLWWLDFDILWPILLIAGGVFVILRRVK